MKRLITLTETEWQRLPQLLAQRLVRDMKRDGYEVRLEGEVDNDIGNYLVGTLVLAMQEMESAS